MLWQGYASVNPAATDLSYLTLRSHQPQAALIDVGDFDDRQPITDRHVCRDNGGLRIQLRRGELMLTVEVSDGSDSLPYWHTTQGAI